MKKVISIMSLCFCLNLNAVGVLDLIKDIQPKSATTAAYVTDKILPAVTEPVKIALLADISLSLSEGDESKFSQVDLDLQRGRRGHFLFSNANDGYVASILLTIEWIKKYPDIAKSKGAINFMITGLINIEEDFDSLNALGITNEQRLKIIEDSERLSESYSESGDDSPR